MRTGRPRKDGERHPCGKLKKPVAKTIAEAQKAAEEVEKAVVLAQPHRRGEGSQMAESPLGRFCLQHKLRRELFDAGEAYATLSRQWASVWGAPMPDRLGGNGGDVPMEQAVKWKELLIEWDRCMESAGGYIGRLSVISLAVDLGNVPIKINPEKAKSALFALAIHQGRINVCERTA